MSAKDLTASELQTIKDHLVAGLSPHLLVLFGSAAKGRLRKDSDIDIAYLSDGRLGDYEVFMLAQQLADLVGREVDLIDLDQASTVFKVEILGAGQIIYDNDSARRMRFQMRTLKDYSLLNEERRPIIERRLGVEH